MVVNDKAMSNPYSTGGGGIHFENEVQACFVTLMLAGGYAPCLPCRPITKIKLQGRYDGYDTDDLVIFTGDEDGSNERKFLGQVKHSVTITEKSHTFGKVIRAAWADFNNEAVFTKRKDVIALITGPLSAIDINDVRRLPEWARQFASAEEFLKHVEMTNCSSESKRRKLRAFRKQLDSANGSAITDEDFFQFMRHFHLLSYDLDIRSGAMHAILNTIIGFCSFTNPMSVWEKIFREVTHADHNAGTICLNTLPTELLDAFSKPGIQKMPAYLSKTIAPRSTQSWNTPEFASALAVASLLGSWDESSNADMDIVRRFVDGEYTTWREKIRAVLQLPDSPLNLRNGVWSVKQREPLWQITALSIFDSHLELFKECAVCVLGERDPQFELDPEDRFGAAIRGKSLAHSHYLRKGLSESLALLGSRSSALANCSRDRSVAIAASTIRDICRNADWIFWGSIDELLPLFAEASPEEFLELVENALSQEPCPFDALFAQEGVGFPGRIYLTGLLWALESLAWDDSLLVGTTVVLGLLAERDPGGRWINRPSNSLTTIFLPWFPQTTATIDRRVVAVQALAKESREVAWRLITSLLPGEVSSSHQLHRPTWRRVVPDDWKDGVTNEEYRSQVSIYADMAVEMALADESKLQELVEHLDNLPPQAFEKVLDHIASDEFARNSEDEKAKIWASLENLIQRQRGSDEAQSALSEDLVSKLEDVATRIEPRNPLELHRRLFSERDMDLYEEGDDWEEKQKMLAQRRENAIREIVDAGGLEAVLEFVQCVEFPEKVGLSLGSASGDMADAQVLPDMLNAKEAAAAPFAEGFVRARYWHEGWSWVDRMITAEWPKPQIAKMLSILPFNAEAWKRSSKLLGDDESEYWTIARVNPYQEKGDCGIAVDKLIEHGRPWAAIHCIAGMIHDQRSLDTRRAVNALLSGITSRSPANAHDATKIIRALQDAPETDEGDLLKVEWAYLPLLNRFHRASPKLLEHCLASDPEFFCTAIRTVYRSRTKPKADHESTKRQKEIARHAYRLLREWKTVPGTGRDGEFSSQDLARWVESVVQSSKESGHLDSAFSHVGSVLTHCPSDPDGLWIDRTAADILNRKDAERMRRGFCLAIVNSRGFHVVDPTGAPERSLATKYRQKADDVENAGYHRLAKALRDLVEFYEHEAERITAMHEDE